MSQLTLALALAGVALPSIARADEPPALCVVPALVDCDDAEPEAEPEPDPGPSLDCTQVLTRGPDAHLAQSGFRWGVEAGAAVFAGAHSDLSPTLALVASYETPAFALDSALRIAIPTGACSAGACSQAMAISWSAGARYFIFDGAVSPFVGGGLAVGMQSVDTSALDGDQAGLGAYAHLGVEFMRTATFHLALGLRLDLPFYALTDRHSEPSAPTSRYIAPVSFGATLTW